MARAEVEVGRLGRVEPAGPRGHPADLGRRPDLLDREPELGGDVGRAVGAAEQLLPGRAPLGERRERHLDEQHRAVAQRLRLGARARRSAPSAPARLSICSSSRARSAGLRSSRPSKHSSACSSAAASVGVGERLGALEVADVEQHQRRARRGRDERRRVGPAHDERQVRVGLQRARHLGDGLVAAGDARLRRRTRRSGDRRAGLEQPGARAEHERRQPVGELDRAVGERHRPDRARAAGSRRAATSRASGAKHASTSRALDAARRSAGSPTSRGLGQPPGDVVLQVGVQPAVARMQLRRRADRQHRRVERVEPEPIDRRASARVGVLRRRGRRRASAPASSEMYSPRSASSWLSSIARDGPHRRRTPVVEELEPAARRLSQRRHAQLPQPRAPSARRAGKQSAARSRGAPRCCDDVSRLVRDQLGAVAGAGVVLARREEDVAADGERPCRHRAGKRRRVVVGVHAHVEHGLPDRRTRACSRRRPPAAARRPVTPRSRPRRRGARARRTGSPRRPASGRSSCVKPRLPISPAARCSSPCWSSDPLRRLHLASWSFARRARLLLRAQRPRREHKPIGGQRQVAAAPARANGSQSVCARLGCRGTLVARWGRCTHGSFGVYRWGNHLLLSGRRITSARADRCRRRERALRWAPCSLATGRGPHVRCRPPTLHDTSPLPLSAQGRDLDALGRDRPRSMSCTGPGGLIADNATRRASRASFDSTRHARPRRRDDVRAAAARARPPGHPRSRRAHADRRVTYQHGPVTEWYSNGPLGLEQGFDVKPRRRRPPAIGSRSCWACSGNARARADGSRRPVADRTARPDT